MPHRFSRALTVAVIAAALPAVARAQSAVTITGRVTGENNQPIAAAQVFIQALGVGTQTRENGTYTLTVPASRVTGQAVTLTARLVGFRVQSAQLTLTGGSLTQNFTLASAPTTLTAVVVTGAGTVSTREKLGNVINSVDAATVQRAAEPQNITSALAGKAPNVEVRTQSGEPGASASIRIRGATSVTGTNQPLFVVDGQPIDNSTSSTNGGDQSTVTQNRAADINPNDIASVEILKGGAAAAIYGARAANGVILITTKSGRAGQTRYTLNSTNTFDNVQKKDILQHDYGQGSAGKAPSCTTVNCSLTSLTWGPAIAAGTPTYDHYNEIFNTGSTLDESLGVSGGSDRTTFYLNGTQTNQNGVIVGPNNYYDRTSIRLKATQQLPSNIQLGGNFDYVNTRGSYIQKGSNTSGLLLGALRTPPNFNNLPYLNPTTGLQRSFRFPNPGSNSLTLSRGYDNPFFTLNNPNNTSQLGRFIGNVNADWKPLSWLRIQETLGADQYADNRGEALPYTSSSYPQGRVLTYQINNLQIDNNLIATGTHDFSSNFTGTLTLGQNLNSRRYNQTYVTGLNLVAPSPLELQNTLTYTPSQFTSLQHIEAYFGQAEADLYNQLYVTAGLRDDGFSTFGASKRNALFPKASVAWAFSNFLGKSDQTGAFSFGKARFAYGETGREPPVYATITALSTGQNNFGSGYGDALNAAQNGQGALINGSQLGNTSLRPERSIEREWGLDLGFFNQRATVGATYYNKRSGDVILNIPINAAQTGSSTALRNAATITNRGFELEVNTSILKAQNYAWDFGLQYGRNKNKVVSLAGAEFIPYNNEGFTGAIGSSTVGYAVGVIRGSDFAICGRGLVIDGVDIDKGCGANYKQGALYLDATGLPVSDPTDRVIADPNPVWTMGFNSQVRLQKFTLSGFLDLRHGGQVWDGTRGILYRFGTHKDTDVRNTVGGYGINWETDRYPTVAGPGAGVAAFKTATDWQNWFNGEGGGFGTVGAQFVEPGSFAKLRELAVAYTADQGFIKSRLGLSSVNIRLAGRNLHTWSKYKGFDPEANLGGAEFLTQGIDYFNNPQTRSFVVNVTLNR